MSRGRESWQSERRLASLRKSSAADMNSNGTIATDISSRIKKFLIIFHDHLCHPPTHSAGSCFIYSVYSRFISRSFYPSRSLLEQRGSFGPLVVGGFDHEWLMNVEWCECWCGLSVETLLFLLVRLLEISTSTDSLRMPKRNLRWLRLFRDKADSRANFLATVNRPWTPRIDPSKCKYCLGFHRHRRPEIFIMYGAALKSRLKIFGSSAVEYFISCSHPHRYLMLMEIGTERKARIKKLCRVRFSESMLGWEVMWRQRMWELPLAGLNLTRQALQPP